MRIYSLGKILAAGLFLSTFSSTAHAQSSPLDYRGAALNMSVQEAETIINERQQSAGQRPYLRCDVIDYRRPEPDHTECVDENENVIYTFFDDGSGTERLWRILAIGSIGDYPAFVEGLDRRFSGSTSRTAGANSVRWTRGDQSVIVRRVCGEAFQSVASYVGPCALYTDASLQARFNSRSRELQRREF